MRFVLVTGLLACAMSQPASADHVELEEVLVVGEKNVRRFELAETVDVGPDSAAILKRSRRQCGQ